MQDGTHNTTHGPKIMNLEGMMELITELMLECKTNPVSQPSVALKVT